MHHRLGSLLWAFIGAISAGALLGSPATTCVSAEPDSKASETIRALQRPVSLNGEQRSRLAALEDVCRQAGVGLQLDTTALTAAGLNLDELVSVKIADEPLQEALGRIIDWQTHWGVCREIRDGGVFLTTIQAAQRRTLKLLPEWLKPVYVHGLIATVDDAGNATTITVNKVMTDELLAKLGTLPKLRGLQIEATETITPAGLAHLSNLGALEKLTMFDVNQQGAGLGDDALRSISGLKSLRELSVSECGTTDAGARFLEGMQQLTYLRLYQEGRLTDAALASVAKLKGLRHLDLTSSGGTESYGTMRFTPQGLRQLMALQDLETLSLAGHSPEADFFAFPKLTALSVSGVDDAAALRIAQCRNLQSLGLMWTDITDDGLKRIATLGGLRRLSLYSSVITDGGIAHLTALPLEYIDLLADQVSDETLKHLAEIMTLTRLDLHGIGRPGANLGKNFTSEGLQQLKGLPKLRTLRLTNLALDGGFGDLSELAQLRELTFMMTNISESEIDALEDALPNTTVHSMSGGGDHRLPKKMRTARGKPVE
jgi:hypothetical protein